MTRARDRAIASCRPTLTLRLRSSKRNGTNMGSSGSVAGVVPDVPERENRAPDHATPVAAASRSMIEPIVASASPFQRASARIERSSSWNFRFSKSGVSSAGCAGDEPRRVVGAVEADPEAREAAEGLGQRKGQGHGINAVAGRAPRGSPPPGGGLTVSGGRFSPVRATCGASVSLGSRAPSPRPAVTAGGHRGRAAARWARPPSSAGTPSGTPSTPRSRAARRSARWAARSR